MKQVMPILLPESFRGGCSFGAALQSLSASLGQGPEGECKKNAMAWIYGFSRLIGQSAGVAVFCGAANLMEPCVLALLILGFDRSITAYLKRDMLSIS